MSIPQKYDKLRGKRILIIGGTSGIGYAVAEASIASNAAAVIVSSSREAKVCDTVARLEASHPSSNTKISGFPCDLGSASTLDENVRNLLLSQCKELDHIVYTAGDRLEFKPIAEMDVPFAQNGGIVRFLGPLMVGKYAIDVLAKMPTSSLILTTGAVSEKPMLGGWTVQASYGAALHGMTKGLALELAPTRVNIVSPGAVVTELWDNLGREQKARTLHKMGQATLTGRVGNVEDVAEAYLYLMKDSNVTGHIISTSGGTLLK